MPNYSYKCKQCSNEWTQFLRMYERDLAVCPKCYARDPARVFQPPATKPFRLGRFDHITDEPVYAGSKKELREICNRYGVDAPGVLD